MPFWLEFHQNTTKIPSKYHPNSRKYHKNSIKIPLKFHKNSGSFRQKWVVFHRNNSGKHAVNLDKIGGSIPMLFQWNSIKIPLWFQIFTSGIPAEFLWNTALKFQHFFRGFIGTIDVDEFRVQKLARIYSYGKFNVWMIIV